ncbi:MAG: hypothetical protein E4H13_11665 [Calditrichales bacterium]|nr:MAG: hypothetical protein E4H13_11665 [Calditrichales bacterium]
MAVKIKQLHQDQGIPLNRIGITFPDIEKYAPLIRQVFHEFQIPFNLSTGFSLQESPLIQAFMQVLRIAARGFSCDDMYQLLLSPFLSAPLVEEADLIRRTAAKYRLTYLTDSWPDLIRGYFKRNKDFPPFDKYYGEKLDSMLEGIADIYTKIKPLSQPLTAAAFHRTYMDTLQGLGLLTWYEQNRDALNIQEQEKEYRAFNRFVKLLDQVVWILKYMHQETPVSPADIYRNVSMVIQNATYNLREWSDYGVQIMPRLEILSLDMETLFVGGMVEGEFPRLFTRDIFFNDNERSEMGLNASEDLLSQDRFLFFQLLSAHAGQMVFSYPAFDTEKQLLPSTFIHALQRAMPGLEIMPPQAEKEYLNENSLLEYLGLAMQTGIQTEEEGLYRSWLTKKNIPRALRWQTGIRSRYERADYSRFTRHEGNLSLSETAKKILEDRFTSRTHSITALESYAFCPMQYFLQRVLRLDAEEELEPSLSSLERGNAVHQVLYEFYDQLNADERKKPWMFADRLNHIAENVFAGLPYTDITWSIEREKYFGYDTSPGLWQVFLETEKQTISQSGFLPSQFEVSFGSFRNGTEKANAPLVIPTENGNVSIVGKIDRIDLTPDGRFVVIDYKTGSSAENIKISHIVEGFSLQLPVYIAAAGKLLKHDLGKAVPAAGIYYRVQDSHHCIQIPVFVDKEVGTELESAKDAVLPNPKLVENEVELTLADLVAKSLDYIVLYDSQIRQGRFQHSRFPDQDKCTKYCDFARICRKNTGKLLAITE